MQKNKNSNNSLMDKEETLLKQKINQSIKRFVREIKKLYWKHQKQHNKQKNDSDEHVRTNINGLNSKQLYKMLTIMIQPHRDISEQLDQVNEIGNQQRINENSCSYNYNYHETENQEEYQFQEENLKQPKNNKVYVISDQSSKVKSKNQFQYVQKNIEKEKNQKKSKASTNANQPEKKIQYYITNVSQQHLIVDACIRYFQSKKSLSRTQISIIARKIVNRQIFKASDKWVRRFLTKYPQLKKCYQIPVKIAKKTSAKSPINNKVRGQVSDDDVLIDESSKKWDEQEVLQNIKKAFKEKHK